MGFYRGGGKRPPPTGVGLIREKVGYCYRCIDEQPTKPSKAKKSIINHNSSTYCSILEAIVCLWPQVLKCRCFALALFLLLHIGIIPCPWPWLSASFNIYDLCFGSSWFCFGLWDKTVVGILNFFHCNGDFVSFLNQRFFWRWKIPNCCSTIRFIAASFWTIDVTHLN